MRDPIPPVSPQPWSNLPQAAVGNDGPVYGTQQLHVWSAGETDWRPLLDCRKASFLWRVSVLGRVLVNITYGTQGRKQFVQLQAPVVITLPGQVGVEAQPIDAGGATAVVTLTPATGGARPQARKFVSTAGALDNDAVLFFALAAAVVVVAGVNVNVPALSSVPLVAGSSLTSGSGFLEFEA